MPVLSIRITDAQQKEIQEAAAAENKSVTDYVMKKLFPNYIVDVRKLTISETLDRIKKNVVPGQIFTIPELFTQEEWSDYTNTISLGRIFRIASKQENSSVASLVDFVEKKSGFPAVYRRK